MSFTSFPKLPAEIRLMIWKLALPASPPLPALCMFNSDCWQIQDSEEDEEESACIRFQADLIDPILIDLPLFCVCHEARQVEQKWLQEHKLESSVERDEDGYLIFIRPFDLDYDALYLDIDGLNDFVQCFETLTRRIEESGREQTDFFGFAPIKNIAMETSLFGDEVDVDFTNIIDAYYPDFRSLWLVSPPSYSPECNGPQIRRLADTQDPGNNLGPQYEISDRPVCDYYCTEKEEIDVDDVVDEDLQSLLEDFERVWPARTRPEITYYLVMASDEE